MSVWHIPPDYIVNNWTEELLNLMAEKLAKRKKREYEAIKGRAPQNKVSDTQLFSIAKNVIKVKKNAD